MPVQRGIGKTGASAVAAGLFRNPSRLSPSKPNACRVSSSAADGSLGDPRPSGAMRVVKLRKLDQTFKTTLCLDGGGMRGLFTVSLMESLVTILKDELVTAARKSPEMFQADDGHPITDAEPFDIDVGDFFDVLSGTSTGSIIATYLANRGKPSTELVAEAQQQLQASRSSNSFLPNMGNLRAGSVQAGQAIFLHSCEQIFAKRPRWAAVDSYLQSANFAQRLHSLPLVGKLPVIPFLVKMLVTLLVSINKAVLGVLAPDVANVADKLVKPGYDSDGISDVLERTYGKTTSLSNGLKTSLVIPTFQMSARSSSAGHAYAPSMGARRPFSFFYLHNHHGDASANGSSSGPERHWGYSSIFRLMTPGEVGIADETQKAAVGHRVMSHHHSNPVLGTNGSTNGSTNGANGNGNGSQMDSAFKRSAADIVYRFGLDFALKDVVRSSAAAPTFFPPAEVRPVGDTTGKGTSQLDTTYVLCDGGVVANNPSAEAVAFTSIAYGKDNKMVPLQEIAVLSLGTGTTIKPAMVSQEFSGQGSWLLLNGPLLDVLTGGSQELSTSLETVDMLASGHYIPDQITRIQLACQWDQGVDDSIKAATAQAKQGQQAGNSQDGWSTLRSYLQENSRMVPDVLLEDPYGGTGEARLLSTILTRMDFTEDKWWLYRLGQDMGASPGVRDSLRAFVRKFVLSVEGLKPAVCEQTRSKEVEQVQ